MKKRLLIFVSILALLAACFFSCDAKVREDEENGGTDGLIYEDVDGGVAVCGYEGDESSVVIPERYKGEDVVAIGKDAFEGNRIITSVVIPDSVKSIGSGAFYQCPNLENVEMGQGVTVIGGSAFSYDSKIKSIVLPSGIKEIGAGAFNICQGLESIILPQGLEKIGQAAFSTCISLKSLVIPESVTTIGANAFSFCDLIIFAEAEGKMNGWDLMWSSNGNNGEDCTVYWDCDRLVLDESEAGALNGVIELDDTQEYVFYFADENGVLEGYSELGRCNDGCFELEGAVIPPFATSVEVYLNGEQIYKLGIPLENLLDGEPFIFGVLSDVHYNRYFSGDFDDAEISFDLALDYLEKAGAKFVGVAGDITSNGEEIAFEKYIESIKDRPFKVYTVTGNHDVFSIEGGVWSQKITSALSDVELAPNGLDYVYKIDEMGGDVFVFLNQVRWDYDTEESSILDMEQLIWLGQVLEEHKDKTVYLFFHTFLAGPDGQEHTGVGNIMNPGGYTYPLSYTYGRADEVEFRRLMKEYKNVVYFSGHSHWMFEMDVYGEETNFSDFDGEYCLMVHVPSVTEPRYIGEMDTNRTGKNGESSQGWIVYDYGDRAVYVPVDFISGVIYTDRVEME